MNFDQGNLPLLIIFLHIHLVRMISTFKKTYHKSQTTPVKCFCRNMSSSSICFDLFTSLGKFKDDKTSTFFCRYYLFLFVCSFKPFRYKII